MTPHVFLGLTLVYLMLVVRVVKALDSPVRMTGFREEHLRLVIQIEAERSEA